MTYSGITFELVSSITIIF